MQYSGVLPAEEVSVKKLLASKSSFVLIDNVLYHQEPDKTLHIVTPVADRYTLFKEAHAGRFGGHLEMPRHIANSTEHTGGLI